MVIIIVMIMIAFMSLSDFLAAGRPSGCGFLHHQAATAQMHLVETTIVGCRPLLRAVPLSLVLGCQTAFATSH